MKRVAAFIFALCPLLLEAQLEMTQVGTWANVKSFSVNDAEDHMMMTMVDVSGSTTRERLYEVFKSSGVWQTPIPVDNLNDYQGATANIGGVFMTSDEHRIYYHANFANGIGGYDIYYSDLGPMGWGEPKLLDNTINTEADEYNPTLSPGEEIIYFCKHQVLSDAKLEKKEGDRLSIFSSARQANGKWMASQPVAKELNVGYVESIGLADDGVTLFYASREDRKSDAKIHFALKSIAETWTLPDQLFGDDDVSDLSPRCVGGKFYCVRQVSKKQLSVGKIYKADLPAKCVLKPMFTESGTVKLLNTDRPVRASLVVFNPTSLKIIGRYESDSKDGGYKITSSTSNDYIVDVRSPGYSFASYMLDYARDVKQYIPQKIELFDTIRLVMSVFDSEIFRPLNSKVIAVRINDKQVFRSKELSAGYYEFALPLGSDYNIIATSTNFEENKFVFKLAGDIVFSRFERNLLLTPKKRKILLKVVDAESGEPLAATAVFNNLKREEKVTLKSTDAESALELRDGDSYDLTVSNVVGYSFHNRLVDLKTMAGNEIVVELIPLKANTAIRLNNINFDTGSAEISEISFPELDRVVKLMRENPSLRIEIAAHTDNVGSAAYNKKLSEKRAESIINYLIENNISRDLLEPKGYGFSMPLVPNTSEENRAVNRRVEFKVKGDQE